MSIGKFLAGGFGGATWGGIIGLGWVGLGEVVGKGVGGCRREWFGEFEGGVKA